MNRYTEYSPKKINIYIPPICPIYIRQTPGLILGSNYR